MLEERKLGELVQEGRLERGTEHAEGKERSRTPGAGKKAVERDVSVEFCSLTLSDAAVCPHKRLRSPLEGSSFNSCFRSK